MPSTINLIRDARVFFTTNVTGGKINKTGHTSSTTFEIQVLDGLSFSQSTGSETVSINEAGNAPVRGQRSYNTTIEAGDWSFSTYMRPVKKTASVTAEEKYLWNALGTNMPLTDTTNRAWVDSTSLVTPATMGFSKSNKLQLQPFGLIIAMKGNTFLLHNCAIEGASIDFGIDQIATIAWTGKCTEIEQVGPITFTTLNTSTGVESFSAGDLGSGSVLYKETSPSYIANKLSNASIIFEGVTYTLPITGGSISVANNLTYLTPSVVGAVNKPIAYFTGTRAFTGSLSAYLRFSSGSSTETGDLFSSIRTIAATKDRPIGDVTVSLGGTTGTRVELRAQYSKLQVPNLTTDQVVGATFDFMPEGQTGIEDTNELTISYYHA